MHVLNLDPSFQPVAHGQALIFDSFYFSGGEPHIKIQPPEQDISIVLITHRVQSFNDFGLLLLSVDSLRRMGAKEVRLILPYFPGARQDRVMIPGEPLTVKIYADLINQLNLSEITILDPHSEVTIALLNKIRVISNLDFIRSVIIDIGNVALVAPDAGAIKKIYSLATNLRIPTVITCSKTRDTTNGRLTGFSVNADNLQQKNLLLIDDICDGGGTFIGLAKELKEKNAGKLYLAITHGIFSKGIEELSSYFETIFTTNTFRRTSDIGLIIKNIKL